MRRRDFLSGVVAGCAAPVISQIAPREAVAKDDIWSKGDYLYCDAALIAKSWQTSVSVAKNAIVTKVGYGDQDLIERELKTARKKFPMKADWLCSYHHHGYSYDDMEHLATFWGVSVSQAKSKVSTKLFNGHRHQVVKASKAAHQKFMKSPAGQRALRERQINLKRFTKSSYTYCDASVLAYTWGMSTLATKLWIGEKIRYNNKSSIDNALPKARRRALPKAEQLCPYWESGYQYKDIEVLAKSWKVNITRAKSMTARKLSQGKSHLINQTIKASYRAPKKRR